LIFFSRYPAIAPQQVIEFQAASNQGG